MSGLIYDTQERRSVSAGLTVDIVESGLSRVEKLLAGVSAGAPKAVGSALKRAASAGLTAVKGAVTREYTLSQSEFLANARTINHYTRSQDGEVSVQFGYAGYVIPLVKYRTRIGPDGRVTTQVKRSSPSATLDHAFAATLGPHTGIYERRGAARFPVRELYGPAVPQMLYSSDEIQDTLEEKMVETYEQRIEHEIMRIMNGWGV